MSDRRSAVFFQVLKTAHLTSPSAMLLECVPGVANHMEIRQGLEDLAELLDFQYVTVIMDLAQVWPCSRSMVGTYGTKVHGCQSGTDVANGCSVQPGRYPDIQMATVAV